MLNAEGFIFVYEYLFILYHISYFIMLANISFAGGHFQIYFKTFAIEIGYSNRSRDGATGGA